VSSRCFATAAQLLVQVPPPDALAIDIPIGLAEAGARACDLEARRVLGRPRNSSVFPAPLRRVLEAHSWEEACAIRKQIDGVRMSKQAWGIVGKVRDVNRELARHPELEGRVSEVHPEVSFRAWAGAPIQHAKRTRAGRGERRALVDAQFGPDAFGRVRAAQPTGRVAHDDILDAFAALWSAERILRREAGTLPPAPPRDRLGLPMRIVC
jgi:predicted RNase H-like nuclease